MFGGNVLLANLHKTQLNGLTFTCYYSKSIDCIRLVRLLQIVEHIVVLVHMVLICKIRINLPKIDEDPTDFVPKTTEF